MVRPAPAARAAARLSEPDFPPPPMTATVGRPGAEDLETCSPTTREVSAGAPHTSRTDSASSGDRSSGSTAAIDRPKRTAWPVAGHLLAPRVPAGERVVDDERGQGQGDEGRHPVTDAEAER